MLRERITPMRLLVAIGIVAGAALRLATGASSLGSLDGDEAAWGLMARHVLDGEFPIFFWNQSHGGTLEVYLTAPLFAVFGSSLLTLRLVPFALTAAAAVLVRTVGRRTIGEPGATAAAVLFWVWPGFTIWKSIREHGFYGSGVVLALLLILLALRLRERVTGRDALLFGFTLGIACWQTAQIPVIALPLVVWLVFVRPEILRRLPLIVVAAAAGFWPWILSNLRHDWWSLHIAGTYGTYLTRLRGFFSATLPMELGLRVPFTATRWTGSAAIAGSVVIAAYLLFAALVVRRRRSPLLPILMIAAAYPFIYALSGWTWVVNEPRYVFLLAPAICLMLGVALTTPARATVAVAAAVFVSVVNLVGMHRHDAWPSTPAGGLAERPLGPAIDALAARGVTRVFADYWTAYALTFATDERVIAAQATDSGYRRDGRRVLVAIPSDIRYPPYGRAVLAARRPGYVAVAGSTGDQHLPAALLRAAGYERIRAGGYVVWAPR